MKLRNLLCCLMSLGIIIYVNSHCLLLFGDYPYPEES